MALAAFLGAVSAGTALAQAQQKSATVGILLVASPATYARQLQFFHRGLRELGYVEGRNITVHMRWADSDTARLPVLANELLSLKPDVIVTSGPGTAVLKRATGSVPIVMAASTNAAESGLVASLSRPGGNITGSSSFARELTVKRLEILKEMLPRAAHVGLLLHSSSAAIPQLVEHLEDAARSMKLRLSRAETPGGPDLARALAELQAARVDAMLVADHTVFVAQADRIATLARAQRLPVIGSVELAEAGGLAAYGVDFPVLWHRAATFVDKILKGAQPGELPVERPTKFELVINLKEARTLGLQIPSALRLRADRVIE